MNKFKTILLLIIISFFSYLKVKGRGLIQEGFVVTYIIITDDSSFNTCDNKINFLFIKPKGEYLERLYEDHKENFEPIYLKLNDTIRLTQLIDEGDVFFIPRVLNRKINFGLNIDSLIQEKPHLFKKWNSYESIIGGSNLIKNQYEKGIYLHIEKIQIEGFVINYNDFSKFENTQYHIFAHDDVGRISIRGRYRFCLDFFIKEKFKVMIITDFTLFGDRYKIIFPEYRNFLWKDK
jgi:hypothetical protein